MFAAPSAIGTLTAGQVERDQINCASAIARVLHDPSRTARVGLDRDLFGTGASVSQYL